MYFIRRRGGDAAERLQSLIDAEFEPEDYPSLTPNSYLNSISVPLLVHHGTVDESVPFEWSVPFRRRLDEAGVEYQFYEYPGENHNISRSFYSVMDRDMAFSDR
jgi:dipeptidyl aminopeptidase/acylaminoacyl peptidase